MNGNTYDLSSIKLVTKKFLELSRCSRAKQTQRNVQKKLASHAGVFRGARFSPKNACVGGLKKLCCKLPLLIRPIVVFHLFPALHALAA